MSNNYGVESFHVSVATGDCAIHLMIQNTQHDKPHILAAVLIDGGSKKKQGNAPSPIEQVIPWIQSRYSTGYDNGQDKNVLKFSAVVVTHWDEDHWAGLMDFFFQGVNGKGTNFKHPNLLYDSQSNAPIPMTWFYAPYWARYYHKESNSFVNGKPDFVYADNNGTVIMNTTDDKIPPLFTGVPIFRLRTTENKYNNLKDAAVVGVNLFNNVAIDSKQFGSAQTLPEMWKANPPTHPILEQIDRDAPGLYILAANRTLLGGIEVPWEYDPPSTPMYQRKAPTMTNQSSIIAIVLWKDHISHYIAGDADSFLEHVVHQLILPSAKITSMKLSHHGSRHSTPLSMVNQFSPENIIVSNPTSGYPHPAWQLVWLLDIWYRASKPIEGTGRSRRIFATKYPHYLFRDCDNTNLFHLALVKQMNAGVFKPEMMKDEAYRTDKFCNEYNKMAGVLLENEICDQIVAKLGQWDENKPWLEIDVLQVLAGLTETIWNRIGFPNSDGMPWVLDLANNKKLRAGVDDLTFLLVMSRPLGDYYEGHVHYKVNGCDDLYIVADHEQEVALSYGSLEEEGKVTDEDNVHADYNDGYDPRYTGAFSPLMFLAAGGPMMSMSANSSKSAQRRLPTRGVAMSPTSIITDPGTDINEMGTNAIVKSDKPVPPRPKPPLKPVRIPKTGYALFANNAFARLKPTGDTQHFGRIPPDLAFNLDVFVGTLKTGVLSLASIPSTETSSDVAFASNDELAAWLSDAVGAKSIAANVDPNGIIKSFSTTVTTKDQLSFVFSSESAVLLTTFNEKDAKRNEKCAFDEPGLMENATVLCLGLRSFTGTTTLSQVTDFMGLKALAKALPIQLLGVLKLQPYMEDGHRNAIWFDPVSNYDTAIRLQLQIAEDSQDLLKTLLQYLDPKTLDFRNTFVIAKKVCSYTKGKEGVRVLHRGDITIVTDISILGIKFRGIIKFSASNIQLTLSVLQETSALATMISWIQNLLKSSDGSNQDFDGSFSQWLNNKVGGSTLNGLQPRSLTLELGSKPNANNQLQVTSINSIRVDIEVNLNYGNSVNPAVFMATYTWQNRPKGGYHSLSADLMTGAKPLRKVQLLPEWEKIFQLDPVTVKTPLPDALDLAALCGIQDFPDGLPSQVTQAEFLISSDQIAFSGRMRAKPPTQGAAVPMISLSNVELAASYSFGDVKQWSIELSFRVLLSPKPEAVGIEPAEITGSVAYKNVAGKTAWKLKGGIGNLSGHLLFSFFDSDSSNAVTELIENISIRSLTVDYDYQGKQASNFTITGLIGLGPVDLSLDFTTIKKNGADQSTWSFNARLFFPKDSNTNRMIASADEKSLATLATDTIKLGAVLDDLLGPDNLIPSFVSNIEFSRPKSQDQISLVLAKDIEGQPTRLVFFVNLDIFGFSFSFMQCKEVSSDQKQKLPTKRIVVASLNDIPDVDLPLIGKVDKPVDQILYMWVQDTSEAAFGSEKPAAPGPKGLTYGEVKAINRTLTSGKDGARELQFKQIKEVLDDKDVVLEAGHHFMMIGKNTKGESAVLLDYVFGKTAPKAPAPPVNGKINTVVTTASNDPPLEKAPGPALAPYKKTTGPLSISNIGFDWKGTPKDGTFSVVIDASILIGPIGFSLMGFKLSFPINDKTSLQNLPVPEVSLDGLAASFNKPPLLLAGAFMHHVENGKHQYMGAILVSYGVYLFQAAGFYGEIAGPDGKDFKSAFIFCRVNGPLMSIGWAELSGLVAGVGYNSSMKFPTASEVPSFPLISPPATDGPLDSLTKLMDTKNGGIITPRLDSFWIAAGVKVTAFQVLKVDAVIVLSFDPTIKIGIFGLAIADLPPSPSPGPGKFVHVELGLSATVDVALGVMKIEGQLTPASYILDPNCHLTGGFAMYSWFDSPDPNLNGDWVFSIGGYHRSFQPPAHYPVPPRLGISWSFNSNISITGEAYFAITPKVCMGGGRLDVTLRAGPLRAWFNAYADFLINYKPFHFMAEGGVSVGIECMVDFCIATITISAHLGATLFIQGPPLSGRVTVDFWIATFDVNFGDDPDPPKKVELKEFFELVLQGDTPNALAGGGDVNKKIEPHVFSCQAGLVPNGKQETPKDAPWVVRGAGFAFSVACKFVVENCTVVTAATKDEKADDKNSVKRSWNDSEDHRFYAKPMQVSEPLKSELEIKIYRESTTSTSAVGAKHGDEEDGWNKVQRVIRPMPTALWGKYDQSTDPSRRDASQSAMLSPSNGTKQLMTGVDIHAPDAKLSVEIPIQFNVVDAMGQNVFESGKEPAFPNPKPVNDAWTPVTPSKNWEDDAKIITHEWEKMEKIAVSVVNMWKDVAAFKMWDTKNLSGNAPLKTMNRFEELYLSMPGLTASG
ncbi:hypothetical protein AOQ84DRAFT_78782 [Glonium stellatum]|uniref:DUF6603 domain-containing protein n=1 Tax=Glonium stellatum TaxID=574774 RepID=A0A8E2JRE3_9PEZI|nr:hypothetical protein AOQ84DRAFT_78782 [Glonium stellatum]